MNNSSKLPYDFPTYKPMDVNFSGLELSSDSGLLLVRQAEESEQICQGIAECLEDERDSAKIKHPLANLISQRIYQIAAGYPDANDSNHLRHDPIFKIACQKLPIPGDELLASKPTISRLENQINKQELAAIRRLFLDKFIQSYQQVPNKLS